MKKLFICAVVVAAAAFSVNKALDVNYSNMSDLQLENIEALGWGPGDPEHNSPCENGCKAEQPTGCTCGAYYQDYNEAKH